MKLFASAMPSLVRIFGVALFASALGAQTTIPTIVTSSLPNGRVGQDYSVPLQATGGTPPYTWSAIGQLPPGISVLPTGFASGKPLVAGSYSFTVTVSDTRLFSVSKNFSIAITAPAVVISTVSLPAAQVGQPYSFTLSASGGTAPFRWTSPDLAAPLTLNSSTGVISGTPTTAGSINFSVQVTDSLQVSATSTLSLTINPPPLTIITIAPIFGGTVGVGYVQTFRASGGTPPYTWSIVSGSAGGLTLDPGTGNLTGTPQTTGVFTFTVQVADKSGVAIQQSFSLTVSPPDLTITVGSTLPPATVGVAYSQRLPVIPNGGTAPYTWSLASPPPGLTFSPQTLTLSGTPISPGSFNLIVGLSDSGGRTATAPLTLLVNPAPVSIANARQLPGGTLNQPYYVVLTASGGQPPYRWSATGLPAGLTLNANTGEVSGTLEAAGSFGTAITVTDSALASSTDRFTLSVALPSAPQVSLSGLAASVGAANQFTLQIGLGSPYPVAISGQAILAFSPESGPPDRTVQFATGGTTANFTIPAGKLSPDVPIALQTGTVSGTINVSLRLQAGGVDLTTNPVPTLTAQVERSAPVIKDVQFRRSEGSISLIVTGYSTTREITQAVFSFQAASGETLLPSASSITMDVNGLFGSWFQDANNSQFGSVFVWTQPFTIQGSANAVTPTSVTVTNRIGSATFRIP